MHIMHMITLIILKGKFIKKKGGKFANKCWRFQIILLQNIYYNKKQEESYSCAHVMITCALGFSNHGQFTTCKQNYRYIIINHMYKEKHNIH